jgi:hypothetical protein
MNKDQLNSAMDKIVASEEFKEKLKNSIEEFSGKNGTVKSKRLIPILAIGIAVIVLGVFYLPSHSNNLINQGNSSEFIITGEMQGEACYISVVYLDGYAYSPSSWINYSRDYYNEEQIFEAGEKLGEVTLDLKGLVYKGNPPDFSSTQDIGTEIYEIKNIKKERAVLVRMYQRDVVFYREHKAISSESELYNLNLADVFQMMTDEITVMSVELRSEEDGSWMRTSENEDLISLINQELPEQPLLTLFNIGKETDSNRVPINLMFEDGAALHMQFYPNQQFAYVFGGYINISEELAEKIKQLYLEGDMYDRITDLLPGELREPSYLSIKDQLDQKEVLCEEPEWSGSALYDVLKYYRVVNTERSNAKQLVMNMKVGRSETDYSEINFYEDDRKFIIFQINGEYYETVMGHMSYEDLTDYLNNYTD